jgi:LysM repeat protein
MVHKSTLVIAQISPSPTIIPAAMKTLVSPSPTSLLTPVSTISAVTSQNLPEINLNRLRDNSLKVIQHKVEKGENNWTIAKKNNIDVYTLIGANPSMPVTTSMKETLNILPRKGVLYTVEKNDDLEKIAEEYHSDKKSIQQENNITWWHSLKVGDVLLFFFRKASRPYHWRYSASQWC